MAEHKQINALSFKQMSSWEYCEELKPRRNERWMKLKQQQSQPIKLYLESERTYEIMLCDCKAHNF